MKWIRDYSWHIFDLGLIVGSAVSVGLRAGFESTYMHAKTAYAITCKSNIASIALLPS